MHSRRTPYLSESRYPKPRLLVLAVSAALWAMARPSGAAPEAPLPTRIEAERIDGRTEADMIAIGAANMTRGATNLHADRLRLDQVTDDLYAEGHVRLSKPGQWIAGPNAVLNIETFYGEFYTAEYSLTRRRAMHDEERTMREIVVGGNTELLSFVGENRYKMKNATYSSCTPSDPDWFLKSSNLTIDVERNSGEATNASLWMKGVPFLWTPWAQFPLDGGRQSGVLPPTIGTSNTTGLDLSLPYYINIAPNYDATVAPRWMSDRGGQLMGEFRYLTPGYFGALRGEVMPDDRVYGAERNFVTWRHEYNTSGWNGLVDVSNASDEFYFADLGTRLSTTSQTLLTRQLTANTAGAGWTFGFNAQDYQTLAGYSGAAPYQRLPQLTGRLSLPDYHGLALVAPAEFTRFAHSSLDEATRTWIYPQVAMPLEWSAFYVTPKVGVHATQYQLNRRTTSGDESIQRAVPSFTLDTGLNFERDLSLFDKAQTQTLEPRLYYVWVPFRDQSDIPNFDTGLADYNFGQVFSENRFSGSDKIGDSNQLTAALTTRLFESETGEEWLRGAVGQRYSFTDQQVTLGATNTSPTPTKGNWLAALSGRMAKGTWLDSYYQYDPAERTTEAATLALRYTDGPGRVVSASYRYRQGNLRDFDLSTQWRLYGGVTGVARYNYNMRDQQLSEALAGFEYSAGCWTLRMVWHSILNTRQEQSQGFFLQLELDGFSSIGSNPVSVLKRNVGGYQRFEGTSAEVMGD